MQRRGERVNAPTEMVFERWDSPYFQTEPRSERADSIGVCFECVEENKRVFCFSRGAQTNHIYPTVGYFPHLLVRRPARSHSWSNVTDRVLESSTRLVSYVYFFAVQPAVVIRRTEQRPLMLNVNNTMMELVLQ